MTIISQSHKFIFVHLHKCGGTSIEKSYEKHANWNDFIFGSTEFGELSQDYYKRKFSLHKHNSASELQSIIGENIWGNYKTFALIRDPKTLYVSFYNWAGTIIKRKSLGDEKQIDIWRKKVLSNQEEEFLKWGAIKGFLLTENLSDFIELVIKQNLLPGEILPRLTDKNGQIAIDNIFKLESIKDAWTFLDRVVGHKLDRSHENRSSMFKEFISFEAKKTINEFHKIDFEYFNYKPFKI
ncbi:sulfotransferase family 2 domain-containing protein [Alphaproteobacteria bacterium]|nr:sulfotransferase family 2 domain-containing protein [Alphaproteobacteria bacterium]